MDMRAESRHGDVEGADKLKSLRGKAMRKTAFSQALVCQRYEQIQSGSKALG
jgi:hypothetical protein